MRTISSWSPGSELEVVLHASKGRLQVLGYMTFTGQMLFWWLWTYVVPQHYENALARLSVALTGIGLAVVASDDGWRSRRAKVYCSFVFWIQLPFFFFWMYLMNENSSMWMASVALMIVLYYQLTDWRLASIGVVSGVTAATFAAHTLVGTLQPITLEHVLVFLFAWGCSILFALSSASLRQERLRHSLTVIGIMAHELRTPLATLSLIAQAIKTEARSARPNRAERLEELAARMDALTRSVNHHIDLQMANAKFDRHAPGDEWVEARQLILEVVNEYPFSSKRERNCLQIVLHQDFMFRGSKRQFKQVFSNLLKNALHSLQAAQSRYNQGDLKVEMGCRGATGRIQIADNGVGIAKRKADVIFEPFFSSANDTGHGLGLAFCRQTIQMAGGKITVQSQPAMGATFIIEMPCRPMSNLEGGRSHAASPLSPA